jgi:hypothetical protein
MKQIISVRSNQFYEQEKNESEEFKLLPKLELVIIYVDGKEYEVRKKGFEAKAKISETRMLVSPELLTEMITEIQLHQKTLDGIRKNADQINALIKHVTS